MADGDITELGEFEYDTAYGGYPALVRISDTLFFQASRGAGLDGYAQVFEDDGSGALSAAGTRYEFDSSSCQNTQAHLVEAGKMFVSWNKNTNNAYNQILDIDGSNDVSAAGALHNYSSQAYIGTEESQNAAIQLSAYKYVMAYWNSTSSTGKLLLQDVDSVTFAISDIGSEGTFDSGGSCKYISGQMISSTHFILFWMKSTNVMVARCFSVDLGTGVFTALGSEVTFEEANAGNRYIDSDKIDASTMIACWYSGTDTRAHARVFNIDGSYAITMETEYNITSAGGGGLRPTVTLYDTDKAFLSWSDATSHAWCRAVDIGATSITTLSALDVRFYLYNFNYTPRTIKLKDWRVVESWEGSSHDGTLQCFDIENAGTISTFKPQII